MHCRRKKNNTSATLHVAVAIIGGTPIVGVCSSRGPGRLASRFSWLRDLPSRHAEHDLLEKVACSKGVSHIYSLALHASSHADRAKSGMAYTLRLAKPCSSCAKLMLALGVKKCTYSTGVATNPFVCELMSNIARTALPATGARIVRRQHHLNLLQHALRRPMFELFVQSDVTFGYIHDGLKTIEGRIWSGAIRTLNEGQVIYVTATGQHKVAVQIRFIRRYASFHKMLSFRDTLEKTLPSVETVQAGVQRYNALYPMKRQKGKNVVAIGLSVLYV